MLILISMALWSYRNDERWSCCDYVIYL